ncbi:MAG: Holliday junction branch migration protein RuvA [Acidimicrobiales bacterium]
MRGVLLDRGNKGDVLVEASGVGYRVQVPTSAHGRLGDLGSQVFLHIHTHVREDAIVLFGFPSRDERISFELLIATHGVGPSVALAILSVHSPAALQRAVATDDVDALTMVPGIGKKTAARLLLELKAKLELLDADVDLSGAADQGGSTRAEVRAALAGLGYAADEIREAVRDLPDEGTVEDHLRIALRQLAVSR